MNRKWFENFHLWNPLFESYHIVNWEFVELQSCHRLFRSDSLFTHDQSLKASSKKFSSSKLHGKESLEMCYLFFIRCSFMNLIQMVCVCSHFIWLLFPVTQNKLKAYWAVLLMNLSSPYKRVCFNQLDIIGQMANSFSLRWLQHKWNNNNKKWSDFVKVFRIVECLLSVRYEVEWHFNTQKLS